MTARKSPQNETNKSPKIIEINYQNEIVNRQNETKKKITIIETKKSSKMRQRNHQTETNQGETKKSPK